MSGPLVTWRCLECKLPITTGRIYYLRYPTSEEPWTLPLCVVHATMLENKEHLACRPSMRLSDWIVLAFETVLDTVVQPPRRLLGVPLAAAEIPERLEFHELGPESAPTKRLNPLKLKNREEPS